MKHLFLPHSFCCCSEHTLWIRKNKIYIFFFTLKKSLQKIIIRNLIKHVFLFQDSILNIFFHFLNFFLSFFSNVHCLALNHVCWKITICSAGTFSTSRHWVFPPGHQISLCWTQCTNILMKSSSNFIKGGKLTCKKI